MGPIVESFIGKFRDECLNEEILSNLAKARAVIERWRRDDNQVRPHSAHGGLTPQAMRERSAGDRLRNTAVSRASHPLCPPWPFDSSELASREFMSPPARRPEWGS